MGLALVDDVPERSVDLAGTVETFYRASGNGGQNRNKRDTAVRLQHPSGITVTAERQRHQGQNRKVAWAELEARLQALQRTESRSGQNETRSEQLAGRGWTWTEWRDEVVDRSTGRHARMSDLLKGRGWSRMVA